MKKATKITKITITVLTGLLLFLIAQFYSIIFLGALWESLDLFLDGLLGLLFIALVSTPAILSLVFIWNKSHKLNLAGYILSIIGAIMLTIFFGITWAFWYWGGTFTTVEWIFAFIFCGFVAAGAILNLFLITKKPEVKQIQN